MDKITAVDLLAQKVQELEEKIEHLECENFELTQKLKLDWRWSEPIEIEESDRPVPRLEIICKEIDDTSLECKYVLVYRHLTGDLIGAVLGCTRIGNCRSAVQKKEPFLPCRNGAHIKHEMKTLNLPGFVVFGNNVKVL